jgi:hypothetical protein
MHCVDPATGSGTQAVPVGQSPSQAGQGERSQMTCVGVQRQESVLVRYSQSWAGNGQGPSHVGAGDNSHGVGSQRHVSVPAVSALHSVPAGHAPAQFGKGDVKHVSVTHSQMRSIALPWQNDPVGHSPSHVGNGD